MSIAINPSIIIISASLVVVATLLVFLFTKPSPQSQMHPVGGSRIKTFLGYLLIKSGSRTKENKLGFEHVDKRIPPLQGKPVTDYNDSFVFLGIDEKGNLIMTRLAFREDGKEKEVWVWMIIDGKRYTIQENTVTEPDDDGQTISAAGLKYTLLDPEKRIWKISYTGKMDPADTPCSFSFTYTPRSKMYHSGKLMDFMGFARAMSEMPWSREYFEKLSSENQTRIEQGGLFQGELTLGKEKRSMEMLAIRDHSWGKRSWSYITRYIWNVFAMEEHVTIKGKEYNSIVFSVADYGETFNHVVAGWIAGPDSILPIARCSNMKKLADDGVIPKDYTLSFKPAGAPVQTLKIHRPQPDYSWIMQDALDVNEAWCSVDLNGKKGYGMAEFGYSLIGDPYGRKK